MSSLVYPALPGIMFNSVRSPEFNNGLQRALSTKESRIAYQAFPSMAWTLDYELLRDYVTPSDFKALFGLYMAVGGRWDTFLYSDPVFNSVVSMPFATADGVTTSFQTTATYQDSGPGAPELIQNFNGLPQYFLNRYGADELLSSVSRSNLALQSNFAASWSLTGTGSTITLNAATAPDATSTAAKYTEGTTSQIYSIQQAQTLTNGQVYTFSCWLKFGSRQFIQLILDANGSGSDWVGCVFDLVNGVRGAVGNGINATFPNASMVVYPNGWYRCSVTGQLPVADTQIRTSVDGATNLTPGFFLTYLGTSQFWFMWGVQLELGSQPTLLLPVTTAHVTQDDYNLGATGIINTPFGAFAAGGIFQWTGSFYYRVRFDDDSMDFSQFMQNFWEVKKVKLKQVKL